MIEIFHYEKEKNKNKLKILGYFFSSFILLTIASSYTLFLFLFFKSGLIWLKFHFLKLYF